MSEVLPFTKNESGRWPGEPALWSMICGDMIVFGAVFNIYMWDRLQNVDMFNSGSRNLNETTGIIFTLLMLVSSWFVAKSLHYARTNQNRKAARMVILALLSGLAFCLIKIIDYRDKIDNGFDPVSNLFHLYYFSVSGMHLLHVIIAMGAMSFVLLKLRGPEIASSDMTFIESVSIFWHLTDFLWIMIFALLYLVR